MRPYYYLGNNLGLTKLEMGYKMLVDTSDLSLGAHVISDGFWAKHIDHFLSGVIKKGDSCLDLGCHMGYTALLMAGLSQRLVVCYDMNADMVELTKKNFALNGLDGDFFVSAITTGKDDGKPKRVHFLLDDSNSGGARVMGLAEKTQPLLAGTNLSMATHARDIMNGTVYNKYYSSFVKIDLEGMDWFVADVMRPRKMILEHRPKDALTHEGKDHTHSTLEQCMRNIFDVYYVQIIQGDGTGYTVPSPESIMNKEHLDLFLEHK